MNDKQLDELIDVARHAYREPPQAPLDEIWSGIRARRGRRQLPWRGIVRAAGIAAALVLSFSLGRLSLAPQLAVRQGDDTPKMIAQSPEDRPMEKTTTMLLGESVVLLSALPVSEGNGSADGRFALQARDLLVTTRLLLDSRAAADPKVRQMLEDLELVLVQIARLRTAPSPEEMQMITETMQSQDLVPRLRSIAAGLSAGDD